MWDLIPWPGIEPWPPTLGVGRLSHWTTREVPSYFILYFESILRKQSRVNVQNLRRLWGEAFFEMDLVNENCSFHWLGTNEVKEGTRIQLTHPHPAPTWPPVCYPVIWVTNLLNHYWVVWVDFVRAIMLYLWFFFLWYQQDHVQQTMDHNSHPLNGFNYWENN